MAMKTLTALERVVDVLLDEIPLLLAGNGITAGSCVRATRVACLALAEAGYKASPLPVTFTGHASRPSALDAHRRFPGHLVALVERRSVLAAREANVFAATPAFMAGEPVNTAKGAYRRIDDNTYLVTADWTGIERDSHVVRAAVRAMRDRA